MFEGFLVFRVVREQKVLKSKGSLKISLIIEAVVKTCDSFRGEAGITLQDPARTLFF